MSSSIRIRAAAIAMLFILAAASSADAQGMLGRVKKGVENAGKQKVEREAVQAATGAMDGAAGAIKCVVTDTACQTKARTEGKQVVLTETDGTPVAKPAADSAVLRPKALKPGEGAWANYDFVPGERVLFADDLSRDKAGDFPRRLEFVGGNMEIVEWNEARWLRAGGTGDFIVPLPETLPERFTLEFQLTGSGNGMEVHFVEPARNPGQNLNFHHTTGGVQRNGLIALGESGYDTRKEPVAVRVMVDGRYVKVFVNETRVANVPNANLGRSNRIWFKLNGWDAKNPRMVGDIRVASGGRDLADALAANGRVATRGIYFDTGSDRIRPESTPTLKEIGNMLTAQPELRLTIEGHTDNVGAATANQALSEQRAAAVKRALLELFAIDEPRLSTVGLGATQPSAPNETPEGRQSNRRVELVRR